MLFFIKVRVPLFLDWSVSQDKKSTLGRAIVNPCYWFSKLFFLRQSVFASGRSSFWWMETLNWIHRPHDYRWGCSKLSSVVFRIFLKTLREHLNPLLHVKCSLFFIAVKQLLNILWIWCQWWFLCHFRGTNQSHLWYCIICWQICQMPWERPLSAIVTFAAFPFFL